MLTRDMHGHNLSPLGADLGALGALPGLWGRAASGTVTCVPWEGPRLLAPSCAATTHRTWPRCQSPQQRGCLPSPHLGGESEHPVCTLNAEAARPARPQREAEAGPWAGQPQGRAGSARLGP